LIFPDMLEEGPQYSPDGKRIAKAKRFLMR